MNESGTFIVTNNFLNKHTLSPAGWDYNTFGYGIGVTFWSRLEVNYVCVLYWGDWSPTWSKYPMTSRLRRMKNQDRHFNAKVLALKEGEIWDWTPSIALGVSDPLTAGWDGEYIDEGLRMEEGNGYFNRMFIVTTKHFNTGFGEISASIGYQFNFRKDISYNAPCAAITWRPVWLRNRWVDPKFILEYDARTPNFGFIADIWDDRFEAMFCLQNFQWVSFGLRFKLRLKGAE